MRVSVLVVALTLGAANASATDYGKWSEYVPVSGRARADVMILGAPREVNKIGQQIQAAAKQNSAWYRAYAAKAEPGKPLPYHKNLGITEDEYKRFLAGVNQMVLLKSGEVILTFEVTTNGTIILKGIPGKPPHNHVTYSSTADVVNTVYGELKEFTAIDQNNEKSPTGRWVGVQWKIERVSSDQDFAAVKFAIGRLKDQSKRIIYYDVNVANQGRVEQYHYAFLY